MEGCCRWSIFIADTCTELWSGCCSIDINDTLNHPELKLRFYTLNMAKRVAETSRGYYMINLDSYTHVHFDVVCTVHRI